MFEKELNFFIANQDELVAKHQGKTLVIIGNKIVGIYDSPLEADLEAQREYKAGSFMIQRCEPGKEAYTITLSSNLVRF